MQTWVKGTVRKGFHLFSQHPILQRMNEKYLEGEVGAKWKSFPDRSVSFFSPACWTVFSLQAKFRSCHMPMTPSAHGMSLVFGELISCHEKTWHLWKHDELSAYLYYSLFRQNNFEGRLLYYTAHKKRSGELFFVTTDMTKMESCWYPSVTSCIDTLWEKSTTNKFLEWCWFFFKQIQQVRQIFQWCKILLNWIFWMEFFFLQNMFNRSHDYFLSNVWDISRKPFAFPCIFNWLLPLIVKMFFVSVILKPYLFWSHL